MSLLNVLTIEYVTSVGCRQLLINSTIFSQLTFEQLYSDQNENKLISTKNTSTQHFENLFKIKMQYIIIKAQTCPIIILLKNKTR